MFPHDAITVFRELSGPSSDTILTGRTFTILGVSVQQSSVASDSSILCGSDVVALNYTQNLNFNLINYPCVNSDLVVSKTGADDASFIITYVPYNTSDFPTTSPNYLNVHETMFIAGVFMFILGLIGFAIIFSPRHKIK